MKIILISFGILMLIAGLLLLIKPEFILGWIESNMENTSLYISAIVIRFVIGILLIIGARETNYPGVIKFFGYLFILISIIFIFIGHEKFQHIIASLIPYVEPYAQVSGLLSMAFGFFIVYVFSRKKEIAQQ